MLLSWNAVTCCIEPCLMSGVCLSITKTESELELELDLAFIFHNYSMYLVIWSYINMKYES